jgi:hypothetical protein
MSPAETERDSFRVAEPNPWKPWSFAGIAAAALVLVAVLLMAALGSSLCRGFERFPRQQVSRDPEPPCRTLYTVAARAAH